ncbi:MAG: hypothetical protein GEV09_01590 [Pseudonocardiaceae bacterium]|nr:hypothetical protein [Pseudonocardiaceae bacterium]
MPRRNSPRRSAARHAASTRPLGAGLGWARTEASADGDWLVRTVPAAQATKQYRCPGCDHDIRIGTAHMVAWPADENGSVDQRRHWHTGCWAGRGRRGPTTRR